MIYIFLIITIIVLIGYFIKNKITIDYSTFFRKGIKYDLERFGTMTFSGSMGSGKTYSCINMLYKNSDYKDIYSNVKLNNINYHYFSSMREIFDNYDLHDCIIFYDELFTSINKNTVLSNDFLQFMAQLRKRKILFITTCQEWLEIPMTFRHLTTYNVNCHSLHKFGLNIVIEQYQDATQMYYDDVQKEYLAPIIFTRVRKYNKRIAEMYDTREVIKPDYSILNNKKSYAPNRVGASSTSLTISHS